MAAISTVLIIIDWMVGKPGATIYAQKGDGVFG